MTSTRTNPAARCPACLKTVDGATGVAHDRPPKPDDICLCFYCGNLNAYQQDLTLRPMRAEEFETLSPKTQADIRHTRRLIAEFSKRKDNSP